MSRLLVYVTSLKKVNGKTQLDAEPLISTTGIEADCSEFTGVVYALKDNQRIPIGQRQVEVHLFSEDGLKWMIDGNALPEPPFFLTDDLDLGILFDDQIECSPNDLLVTRLSRSKWAAYAVSVTGLPAIICPIVDKELGQNRLIVVGCDETVACKADLRDIDNPDEILGEAFHLTTAR
jgi:hypothetical protein